ncbi:helix-turn-helix domain-containing protein, partial [Caldanaerobacter subterraneus]
MGNFDKKKFAELLALAKGNRSINQYALQCGVSSAHISRLLRGLIDTPPNPETIKKFASKAHNGVTYEELMEAAGHIDSSSQLTEQNQFYEFSQRLRQLREEKGLLQKDVAKILGITPSAYG